MLRPFLYLLLLGVLAASCRSHRDAAAVRPAATHHAVAGSAIPVRKLSYEDQRRFDKLFLEAIRQKELEQVDAESELLDAALRINPDAPEALYEMALLKLSFTTYSDTLSRQAGDSLLRRAVALAPANSYYKETLATVLANSAKYREAIRLYEELAEARLTDETLMTLIWLYKTSGDYAGAIRTIDRLERLDGRSEALSMEKFQTYLAMKDDEHAYQSIEDLCAEYPLDLRYRVLLGDLYARQGYYERALDIYRDVIAAEPDNSYAQLSLLAYYKDAGADSLYTDYLARVVLNPRTQESARLEAMRSYALDNIQQEADSLPVIRLFLKAMASPQVSRDMAELYAGYVVERHMPTDSVVKAMQRVIAIVPDYTKARLQLLSIYLQRDNMHQVVTACREGTLYDPVEVTFYYYEGVALFRLGNNHAAIDALQRGAERITETTDKDLASDLYALLGDVLHESKLTEEAYLAYDRALSYNKDNLLCLNNYAYFLSLASPGPKRLEQAEEMSLATIVAEPENTTYLDTYAWIKYLQRDYAEARTYIDRALAHAPATAENASVYDHAGDIYYRNGQRVRALELWRQALRIASDPAFKRKVQRKVWRRRP